MTRVPKVESRKSRQIERDAVEILKLLYPENLEAPKKLDVLDFFEQLDDIFGLTPGVEDLSDGVEGMTWPDGRVLVSEATFLGARDGRGRPRFTICHEAYHGLQHRHQIENVLIDNGELVLYRRSQLRPYEDPEWQANVFASCILMPTKTVQMVAKEAHGKLIEDMIWLFGVSKSAAKVRLSQLRRRGLIPE